NLTEPNGTCYFSEALQTAVREMYGPLVSDSNSVSAVEAARLRVSVITPPIDVVSAHVSGSGVARYGVTSELTTMGDYSVPQQWALRLHDEGFDAIRYNSRFAPGTESWALFGPAGPHDSLGVDEHAGVAGIDAVLAAGIDVDPLPPRKSSVRLVADPPA
ncbi:MAG: hypothetical protein JWP75_3278, partial [Frondihabitans sp.]|nr:hypothetical protein [Frondihabitans sp.]